MRGEKNMILHATYNEVFQGEQVYIGYSKREAKALYRKKKGLQNKRNVIFYSVCGCSMNRI